MQFHQSFQLPALANRRGKRCGTHSQDTRFHRQCLAIRIEFSKHHEVRIQVRANSQHGCVAKPRRWRQPVAIQFRRTARVRVNLLPRRRQSLNRQLFQPFAKPIEPRTRSIVLERKYQKDSLRGGRDCWMNRGLLLSGRDNSATKQAGGQTHYRCVDPFHSVNCSRARICDERRR